MKFHIQVLHKVFSFLHAGLLCGGLQQLFTLCAGLINNI